MGLYSAGTLACREFGYIMNVVSVQLGQFIWKQCFIVYTQQIEQLAERGRPLTKWKNNGETWQHSVCHCIMDGLRPPNCHHDKMCCNPLCRFSSCRYGILVVVFQFDSCGRKARKCVHPALRDPEYGGGLCVPAHFATNPSGKMLTGLWKGLSWGEWSGPSWNKNLICSNSCECQLSFIFGIVPFDVISVKGTKKKETPFRDAYACAGSMLHLRIPLFHFWQHGKMAWCRQNNLQLCGSQTWRMCSL